MSKLIRQKQLRTDSRTETSTVRLAPRTQWMIEVAARIQRRSLSAFIAAAAEDVASEIELRSGATVGEAAQSLWDPDPDERIYRLALVDRTLITFDEEQSLVSKGKLPVATFIDAMNAMEAQCEALTDQRDQMKDCLEDLLNSDIMPEADAKRIRAILEAEAVS